MRIISLFVMLVIFLTPAFGRNYILKKDSKSIATGITICFKNKKFLEKKHNIPAASDFVAHLFKIKSKKYEDNFKSIGAELQFYDYPFIPFDDYYTNDYFGFIRIKVLPEYTDKALFLTSKLINDVLNFTEKDFKLAKKSVFSSNVMRNRSKERAKKEIWNAYFPESFFTIPDYLFATELSKVKLKAFLKEYLNKANIFISIYGIFNEQAVKKELKKNFYTENENEVFKSRSIVKVNSHKKIIKVDSKQALIYIVYPVNDAISLEDFARLKILTANCSDRISFQIREKEGLAYFVGCNLIYKGGHCFFVAYCGTNPEKSDYVLNKMNSLVKNYMLAPINFNHNDLNKIKNGILFSNILKTLPNINKSFFNALYTFTGYFDYNKNILDKVIKKVKINRLCGREYLVTDNYLNIILK